MNREKYIGRIEYIKNKPLLFNIVKACYYIIPCIIGMIYIALLISMLVSKNNNLMISIGSPAVAFISVSVFRKLFNAKRPYETYEYSPLIAKNKAGESFPSRHTASAFAIATTCMINSTIIGIITIIMAVIVAIVRVMAGVHFAKDVIAGAIAGSGIVVAVWQLILVIIS